MYNLIEFFWKSQYSGLVDARVSSSGEGKLGGSNSDTETK